MSNIGIQCKTRKQFEKLMKMYDKLEWKWYGGGGALANSESVWESNRSKTCVDVGDGFCWGRPTSWTEEGGEIVQFKDISISWLRKQAILGVLYEDK